MRVKVILPAFNMEGTATISSEGVVISFSKNSSRLTAVLSSCDTDALKTPIVFKKFKLPTLRVVKNENKTTS
jgi:hypothetical protein